MNEPLSIDEQKKLLADLRQFAARRVEAEAEAARSLEQRTARIEEDYRTARQRAAAEFDRRRQELESEFSRVTAEIEQRFQQEQQATRQEYQKVKKKAAARHAKEERAAGEKREDAKWEASSVFDATKNAPRETYERVLAHVNTQAQALTALEQEAGQILIDCGLAVASDAEPEDVPADQQSQQRLQEALAEARERLERLKNLRMTRLMRGPWLLVVFAVAFVLCAAPAGLILGFMGWQWIAAGVVGMAVLGGVAAVWLHARAKSQVIEHYAPLAEALATAAHARDQSLAHAKQTFERQTAEVRERYDNERRRIEEEHESTVTASRERRDTDLQAAEEKYPQLLKEQQERRDQALAEANEKYPRLLRELSEKTERESRERDEQHHRDLEQSQQQYEEEWEALAEEWRSSMGDALARVTEINHATRELFPSWMSSVWHEWQPAERIPPVIRFGQYEVSRANIPGGTPDDPRLETPLPPSFALPSLMPFPGEASMLYLAHERGREVAVQSLQSLMLRLLTSIPPSKVRFTIIDPVGLGENFAGFMHLADYDEKLVTNRIWTEPQHIEQRLGDLTEQMENVIQKYLRNEFNTIEEYNDFAGEVAEPFRVLVVANFPNNFTDAAVRRLISVASSGARCGVYTLITVDTQQKMPRSGFNLDELKQHATVLEWNGERFEWQHPDFQKYPLELDVPPSSDVFTKVVRVVGEAAREAGKVEVPFEHVVPSPDNYWTEHTDGGIVAPLGRAGATKLQNLALGKGTAQHVLTAGKTGSGKSTLLHVLITNLALRYSPDEMELYLIDFKKGVEFKRYANYDLPHARVVAIESEREFGLSVLERLDVELKQRGDAFRQLGVQDIKAYREASGKPLPRILLMIDEFQELFVEDDRIAQQVSLLLDRLVRQGRAFGIHVMLGSQTLGGAYSLARSTLGQMAVRIALQCSETDAHLILSDDNSAARLLSRPGEAIYNDANGLMEGNKPFQIVWLPENEHEVYLKRIADLAAQRHYKPPHPQIVFEGNVPADITRNHLLTALLEAPACPELPAGLRAWLGDAVAIKDPTAAVFRPQAGSNLLIVGQRIESALGIEASVLLSLAAQIPPGEVPEVKSHARFYILDGSRADSEHVDVLGDVADSLPHPTRLGRWREVSAIVAELAAEVDRRTEAGEQGESPPIFLFIHDLGRFRDLRRDEGDFGFGGFGQEEAPASPAKQFGTILREGPGVGVYVIAWCDSVNNLNRALDRQTMREFELRVLFQMSPTDSANLIDSPQAANLGVHRALFYSEEEGSLEKFRPYSLPELGWLTKVGKHLAARTAGAANRASL